MSFVLKPLNEHEYSLSINQKTFEFSSQMQGLSHVLFAAFKNRINATDALSATKQIQGLSLRYSLQEEISKDNMEEFRGIIDFFERKIDAEKTGKPALFLCAGCGLHAFLLGKNFLVTTELGSKEDVFLALLGAYSELLISKSEFLHFQTLLKEMHLRDEPSGIETLKRSFLEPFHVDFMVSKTG
jgi:hypothetical protein